MKITDKMKIELLRTMLKIRRFEMMVNEHFQKGDIPGFAHLYVGEEATATGVCAVLSPEDYITSTHRGHAHCIAKGTDLKRLMAELWGRETGCCKGRGGSMHIFSKENNILGTNGIVGGGLPLALGAAFHSKLKKSKQVCACFFGDGAANNGTFHEAINIAAVQNLAVIFVCENNLYATATSVREATRTKDFADRATGYCIPGVIADGNDILDVVEKAEQAVRRARNGDGPSLLECKTYRHLGHYIGEPGTGYRTQEEVEEWKKKDPIKTFCKHLEDSGIIDANGIELIEHEVDNEIKEATEFAKDSPFPHPETAEEYAW